LFINLITETVPFAKVFFTSGKAQNADDATHQQVFLTRNEVKEQVKWAGYLFPTS